MTPPINLKLLRAQLEAEGHAVFEAHNGVDALALLERQRMDVLISDIFMPEMDGYRLCYEIRKHARLHDLPIILCTSTYTSPGDEKLVRDVGADKYLKRPVSRETIVAALHEVLAMPHAAPQPKAIQEVEVLKEYSERLVSKLEEKNTELQAQTEALTAEIVQRKQIETKMRELAVIVESTDDAIISITQDGNVITWNRGAERLYGHTAEEVRGQRYTFLVPQEHRDEAKEMIARIGKGEHVEHYETTRLTKDGGRIFVSLTESPIRDETGEVVGIAKIARDITQRKAHEARIVRLNRIYSVLSGINAAILRIQERQQLFDEACRIAVEHGKFTFAWIGTFDADTQQVTPVARAGRDDGYLSRINLSVAEDVPGNCPLTAEAITQAKPGICNDIASDDDRCARCAWRAEALQRGYRSVTVFPLMLGDRPVGVFVLYASETDIFDEEEMRLLVEMAGDISFALDHLEKEERLNYLAYYDAVTGLPNRTLFLDRVAQKINAARRDGKVFSVIMLDLNRFRSINETLGRQAGDDLLRQLAQRLQGMLGETDILAHFSADYFGIATRCNDASVNIVHVLERILSTIQDQPFLVGGQELRVSAMAGVSSYPSDSEDIEALFHNAGAALKKAKLSGDKYLFYAPAFNALAAEKLTLENKLRRALEQEQLVLHYQPKVNLKNGQICGLEALLRWNDPETGLVPPMKFIPLLEETGMILEAGRWALVKAVSDILVWQSKGLVVPRIAVNVSAIQLQQKDFVDMVAQVISGAKNAAVKLELEITESLIMQDIQANILKLRATREIGIEVSIDDFGTGYSSLSYLAKLPVNALKIDRAFIINMASNADDLSIVAAIISLAHSLNLRVIAEGVETEEQANLLRLHKCDEIQGYLFSPAVPAEKIEAFLRENKALGNQPK